ncbi:MAG: hypothetical protein IT565_11920 [Rhodospirillales bacterium]|nr:hypothetical protein [Rhodospirillales bacterium]
MGRKIEIERRCLPVEEWPLRDREAWVIALREGDPFGKKGKAAHWRPLTRKRVESSYGRWLGFLALTGDLDPDAGPGNRITDEWLKAYLRHLAGQVAPVTMANRLVDLGEALRVMETGADLSFLKRAASRMAKRAIPVRNKDGARTRPQELLGLGQSLLAKSERAGKSVKARALLARDGLAILILTCRPVRIGNLISTEIGHSLVRTSEGFRLRYGPDETKNHRPFEVNLPRILTVPIERYLEIHRPVLLGTSVSRRLWIKAGGEPVSDRWLCQRIGCLTEKHLGVRLTPHLFRDMAVTALAIDDPNHIGIASPILHHADPRIRDRNYNQAHGFDAIRRMQADLAIRREAFSKLPSGQRTRKRG